VSASLLDGDAPNLELVTRCAHGELDELRRYRGKELHAGGRRPSFRVGEGAFFDADEHDVHAYHLVSRCPRTGDIVATIRVMPIASAPRSQVETMLGPSRADQFLAGIGAPRARVAEVARWIVRQDQRGKGLGLWLFAGAFALANAVGIDHFWSAAGTRDGQCQRALRIGFGPILGTAVTYSERYADDIRLIHGEVARPSAWFAPLVERMAPEVDALVFGRPSRPRPTDMKMLAAS